MFILAGLFIRGGRTRCEEADCNSDGAINVGDAVFQLNYQFRGGPPPEAPFPKCEGATNLSFPVGCRDDEHKSCDGRDRDDRDAD